MNIRGMSIYYEKLTNLNLYFQALNLLVLPLARQQDALKQTVNKPAIVQERNVTNTQRPISTVQLLQLRLRLCSSLL